MIPIFIITCDRVEMLRESMQSYCDRIETPTEFIIIDMGSTYPPMIEHLSEREKGGVKIYRESKVNSRSELNKVNASIQDYFRTHPSSNYVVTDPDICFDDIKADILEVYAHLLKNLPEIVVVGPMLRIDDIPKHYPLRRRLLTNSRHKAFHEREVYSLFYNGGEIKFIYAKIDTTFGMYRAGSQWRRLQGGVRVLAPYSAKHLDWYIDPENIPEDQRHYMQNASRVAHWSKWK